MKGVGIDLCQVSRIERAEELTGRFLQSYYTEEERAYIHGRGKAGMQSAAAFFAAKEALLKAMGLGIGRGVRLRDIGISHTETGAPFYRLTGTAEARFLELGGGTPFLSLTHERDFAAAFCVIE